jgi:hypothetical protein
MENENAEICYRQTLMFLSSQVKTGNGAQSVSHLMCTDGSFQAEKGKSRKGHSLPFITHVKNAWSYFSTILHIFVTWR